MIFAWLLLIFIACSILSLLLCGAAKTLFPRFRSGEYKPGAHRSDLPAGSQRSDLPAGGREIKTIELPLVGGPAFTLAICCTAIAAGYLLGFSNEQWRLLLIGLGATLGYLLVGFVDDWHKVYRQEGIPERTKLIGVFLVSVLAALLYFFLLPSGKESYSPYKDLPLLSTLLCGKHLPAGALTCTVEFGHGVAYFGWLLFLMLLTGVTGSVTSLSVDFSDGLDGLAGGLVFSAALAFAIIMTGIIDKSHPTGIVFEVLALLCAAGVLGYLPWNWPSSWAARRGTAKRKASIIMGDSGALSLGGLLAVVALFSHQEITLLMVGGAFVLEGLSALISARMMTPFYRGRLQLLRFAGRREFVPHTEFPLPFLATPLHSHFDLLGWDRRRLVYSAWALGACFALLGVMSGLAPLTWERYLGRILVLILAWLVWSTGSWTKKYFVGKHPADRTRRSRLALYYGYPYTFFGFKLYHLVEVIEASADVVETPIEDVALWQRMSIFDARAMLGLYCYRAGYYPAAVAQWTRIPEKNRTLRPEIARLLEEVDSRLALEKQATQPIRRDQILRQEPILTGNLSPADLPNPHEPVRSDEIVDGGGNGWVPLQTALQDEEADEQRLLSTLNRDPMLSPKMVYGMMKEVAAPRHEYTADNGAPSSSHTADSGPRAGWFARLLRFTSGK